MGQLARLSPSVGLYPFDGYRWLRDGAAIAGQTAQSYTPTSADVGHQLACQITATYPLPLLVTAAANSPAITVRSPPAPPSAAPPSLSALRVSPATFRLTGRRVGRSCRASTPANRNDRPCIRAIVLSVSYKLTEAANVALVIERTTTGRLVTGRCKAPTRTTRTRRPCTRVTAHATITHRSKTGTNRLILRGQIRRLELAAGRYTLLATPTTGQLAGKQRSTTFRIMP